MKTPSRMKHGMQEIYKEFAAGLFVAFLSQLLELLQGTGIAALTGIASLSSLALVIVVVGLVAPLVDEQLAFAAGYVVLSVIFALTRTVSIAELAFNLVFTLLSLYIVLNMKRGQGRRMEQNVYVLAIAIIAVVSALVFFGINGAAQIAPASTTTTSLNTTSTIATTSSTSTLTTTIVKYSGCSTIERDQPFNCGAPVLSAPANLSFTLYSNDTNDTLYNLDIACTNGFGFETPSQYQFYYLQANGTFSQGLPGTSITAGSPIRARDLPCYGISNASAPFNGILWVAYHPGSQATPLQTAHIQVYYNMTSVPPLVHVNNTAGENLTSLSR
jgi:hypothetical protein